MLENLKKLMLAFSVLSIAFATGCTPRESPASEPFCPSADLSFVAELPCESTFTALSTSPSTALFANTASVKFVIDLEDNNATYFANGHDYSLHYNFCSEELDDGEFSPVGTHAEFNQEQYRQDDRRFLLGTLTIYGDHDIKALEFATGDLISSDQIRFAFQHIRERVYFGDALRYRPVSIKHEAAARGDLSDLPIVFTEDLYEGISYQPLNPGEAFGYVRILRDGNVSDVRPTDIVVLPEAPNDIQPVAAVITQRFQTPLSHVNILSKNRRTPNMGLVGALEDPLLNSFDGQLVRLSVDQQRWSVRAASLAEAEEHWDRIRPRSTFLPRLDLTVTELVDLQDVGAEALPIIGAKAANMAEMTKLPIVTLPDQPFAIPFAHYREHLDRNHISEVVAAMLVDERFRTDPGWRATELAALRETIRNAPMNPVLQSRIWAQVDQRFGDARVRFRSSTNSEDLPNFNGAGLYKSYAGSTSGSPRPPSEAVRRVWASLWTDRAVAERDFYRIDHTTVAMAVLVHPAFVDEAANGVALTSNIFDPRRPGYFINVQAGEASVTNPGPGDVPDQFLLYTWYADPDREELAPEVEYLSYSNLTDGEPVLVWSEILELTEVLGAIHRHFKPPKPTPTSAWPRYNGMDVEFKLMPGPEGRQLFIKQARPVPL